MVPRRHSAATALLPLLAVLLAPGCLGARVYYVGDSLLDVGNANYLNDPMQPKADFPPYGMSMTPPGPTGRFSDGKVFSDFVAEKAGIPSPPAYLTPGADFSNGINFAVAGAVVKLFNISVTMMNVDKQMQFLEYEITKNGLVPRPDDIMVAFFSSDDLLVWLRDTPYKTWGKQAPSMVSLVTLSAIKYTEKLFSLGFKNIIVGNIPPVGCLPQVRAATPKFMQGKCLGAATKPAVQYNSLFETQLAVLRSRIPQANIVLVDLFTTFTRGTVELGLQVTSPACCGYPKPTFGAVQCGKNLTTTCSVPGQFAYWDSIHPTQAMVKKVFDLGWSSNLAVFVRPMNVSSMFARAGIRAAAKMRRVQGA